MQLDPSALDQLFVMARTHSAWSQQPVADALLRELYDLLKWGPTSANCSPARLVFVKSAEAKARLLTCMAAGNVDKTRTAPVTAIIAMDMSFFEFLPQLFPHTDARAWFAGNADLIATTAMRNSSLQGGYLMVAARALGLDCGPMSGFDADKVNAAFFRDSNVRVNFICNLGYGEASRVHARNPRLAFEQACRIE